MIKKEQRRSALRRQFNQSFLDAHENVIISKVIAVTGQIMLLYYTALYFGEMIASPETLLICLAFIIMPDVVKKLINMKYANEVTTK